MVSSKKLWDSASLDEDVSAAITAGIEEVLE